MKKTLGYILSLLLVLSGIVLLFPFALGAVCCWAMIKLRCWARGQHIYDPQQILLNIQLKSMRCTKCYKLISPKEEPQVQAQIDVFVMSLKHSREFLNEIFNTPEERAVEKLINETKN